MARLEALNIAKLFCMLMMTFIDTVNLAVVEFHE